MLDMVPSLRDLAKFAGLAVGLSKQTLVDDLVQFLCTHREDTAADAFLKGRGAVPALAASAGFQVATDPPQAHQVSRVSFSP